MSISFEESKLDELFEFKFTYEALKSLLRQLLEKVNLHSTQMLYMRELSDKLQRQITSDKAFDHRIAFLE